MEVVLAKEYKMTNKEGPGPLVTQPIGIKLILPEFSGVPNLARNSSFKKRILFNMAPVTFRGLGDLTFGFLMPKNHFGRAWGATDKI